MEQENKKSYGGKLMAIFAKSVLVGGGGATAMGLVMRGFGHGVNDALTFGAYFGTIATLGYLMTKLTTVKNGNGNCCEHHKPKEP